MKKILLRFLVVMIGISLVMVGCIIAVEYQYSKGKKTFTKKSQVIDIYYDQRDALHRTAKKLMDNHIESILTLHMVEKDKLKVEVDPIEKEDKFMPLLEDKQFYRDLCAIQKSGLNEIVYRPTIEGNFYYAFDQTFPGMRNSFGLSYAPDNSTNPKRLEDHWSWWYMVDYSNYPLYHQIYDLTFENITLTEMVHYYYFNPVAIGQILLICILSAVVVAIIARVFS